jgi:hypothetical protein
MSIACDDLLQPRPGRKFSVEVEAFKSLKSGSLHGFCDVTIPELKLKIHGLTVHESHGRTWVGLLGKPMIDKDGRGLRDDRGKPQYSPVLKFLDRNVDDAFSARVGSRNGLGLRAVRRRTKAQVVETLCQKNWPCLQQGRDLHPPAKREERSCAFRRNRIVKINI